MSDGRRTNGAAQAHDEAQRSNAGRARDGEGAALLVLNASNFPGQPVYPYAFVQLRALARQAGLQIRFEDLLGFAPSAYAERVARLVAEHRPRMVGVHLRQADSVVYANYASERGTPYFPVEDTAALIAAIRGATDAPLVLGGFGFTTHASELFAHLRPDFAVEGEPDGFFRAFEDVCARRQLERVDNLIYSEHGVLRRRERSFYAPLDEREYDESTLGELEAFYGRSRLYGSDAPSVAVELARGCPYRCYFCTEPAVKGRSERRRNLDAVMADVEFLASRGVRRLWLVCSEINLRDSSLALQVAERFVQLEERRGFAVRWHAYHLPRWLTRAELALLHRAGYAGGWNDFPSLDDDNLRKARVPYRSRHVLEHVESTLALGAHPAEPAPRIGLFLGNAFADTGTFARSLKVFNDAGLAARFAIADVGGATRAFAHANGADRAPGSDRAVTFTSAGRAAEIDLVHPTFYLSPALSAGFSSEPELLEFLAYVGSTLLSTAHLRSKDWPQFLATSASPAWLSQQVAGDWPRALTIKGLDDAASGAVTSALSDVAGDPSGEALRNFLLDRGVVAEVRRAASLVLIRRIASEPSQTFLRLLRHWSLAHDARGTVTSSTYEVLTALLARYDSVPALFSELARQWDVAGDGRDAWLVRLLLFSRNVVLRASYRPFLLQSEAAAGASSSAAGGQS